MESNTTNLRESLFFTARKARLPNADSEPTPSASSSEPSSSSSRYYSARIHSIMERMSELDMNQEDAEIEASKDHWTQMESKYHSAANSVAPNSSTSESSSESDSVSGWEGATGMDLALFEENFETIRSLQRQHPGNEFFEYEGDWVLGRKIAEGGQAAIYEAVEFLRPDGEKITISGRVLKVFKAGYSLEDLLQQWPFALLHKLNPSDVNFRDSPGFCNAILCGRLLGDGRFAFEMPQWWGDLRKLMDLRMQHNGNQHPPFMVSDGNYLECCMLIIMLDIAMGMRDLHQEGTLHRDLKASNVLIDSLPYMKDLKEEDRLEPMQLGHNFICIIADFECSIGVMGTGYWRAPEILEAVKNRAWATASDLLTPKSDAYSYAMTCYEILTGYVPFEDIEDMGRTTIDDVLQGKRPKLPIHLKPWIKELLSKCWHMDPSKQPTFQEIVDVLVRILDSDPSCQSDLRIQNFINLIM